MESVYFYLTYGDSGLKFGYNEFMKMSILKCIYFHKLVVHQREYEQQQSKK
jgi:hypothetical protein